MTFLLQDTYVWIYCALGGWILIVLPLVAFAAFYIRGHAKEGADFLLFICIVIIDFVVYAIFKLGMFIAHNGSSYFRSRISGMSGMILQASLFLTVVPVVTICALVFIYFVIIVPYLGARKLLRCSGKDEHAEDDAECMMMLAELTETTPDGTQCKLPPGNMYEDLDIPLSRIVLIFIAQAALVLAYITHLETPVHWNADFEPEYFKVVRGAAPPYYPDSEEVQIKTAAWFMRYGASIILQYVVLLQMQGGSEDEVEWRGAPKLDVMHIEGSEFLTRNFKPVQKLVRMNTWICLMSEARSAHDDFARVPNTPRAGATTPSRASMAAVALRFTLAYTSNFTFAYVIALTLPLFLATAGDWMDWVKDAFAITFIMDLDNTIVSKQLLARLRKQV